MIVTCEACDTQFQLDDSKVPESGIRVRCSRCKHSFHIDSPRAPDADRANELARDALQPETAPIAVPGAREAASEEAESDWQFNEGAAAKPPPPSVDARSAARVAVDDLLGGVGVNSEATEPVFEASPDADLLPRASAGGFDLDGSDFDIPDLDDPPDPVALDVRDDEDALAAGEAENPLPVAPSPEAAGDFEDVTADEEDAEFAAAPELRGDSDLPVSESENIAVARMRPEVLTEVDASSRKRRKRRRGPRIDLDLDGDGGSVWIARARAGLGWAVVGALLAFTALAGLWPASGTGAGETSEWTVAGLTVEEVEGRWLDNAAAGPLYVISGWLRGAPTQRPETAVQLRVRLLDADGTALVSVSSALGPPLREDQLREWNLPDLREFHERRGLGRAWKPRGANDRRRFQAILADVPAAATGFEFQAVQAANPSLGDPDVPASPFEGRSRAAEITSAPTG